MTAPRAVKTAEQKEHRLSKPGTKEQARRAARAAAEVVSRDYCSLVPRPWSVFRYRKATESWAGPENDLRLLLSSLILSSGLGTRLTAEASAITNQIVAVFLFMRLLAAALLSFMPCTACSGSPHNATHSASI